MFYLNFRIFKYLSMRQKNKFICLLNYRRLFYHLSFPIRGNSLRFYSCLFKWVYNIKKIHGIKIIVHAESGIQFRSVFRIRCLKCVSVRYSKCLVSGTSSAKSPIFYMQIYMKLWWHCFCVHVWNYEVKVCKWWHQMFIFDDIFYVWLKCI